MLKNLIEKVITANRSVKILIVVIVDIILSAFATLFSFIIRLDLETILIFSINQLYPFIVSILLFVPIFYYLKIYDSIFRYFNVASLKSLSLATLIYGVTFFLIIYFNSIQGVPRSIAIIQPIFFLVFLLICRILFITLYGYINTSKKSKNIFIYGAGNAGAQLINLLGDNSEYNLIGLIDDDIAKIGKFIYGIKIYSFIETREICSKLKIDEIFIAISNLSAEQKKNILKNIEKLNIKTNILPRINELLKDRINLKDFKEISVTDLIERKVNVNFNKLRHHFRNKKIIITGAGGSIGSELCIQLIKCEPETLILIDQSEYNLYLVEQKLLNTIKQYKIFPNIKAKLIDVKDKDTLQNIFKSEEPDCVFHTAAYKHVPLVEKNIKSAIENNYLGTKNVIDVAIENKCQNFVLISTDKAVRPTNIMGATKRLSEMYVQAVNNHHRVTSYSIVRFGNVLGSSGSVVPLFTNQINSGGPITVTSPDVTRYFMTIPEAASLILKSTFYSKEGNIFVLDMGKPIKILDLAKKIINLSGHSFNTSDENSIKIEFTGLRPGEKMHEELYSTNENVSQIDDDILLINDKGMDMSDYLSIHSKLERILESFSEKKAIKFFEEHIDGFVNESNG